jgi:hypothetical protein
MTSIRTDQDSLALGGHFWALELAKKAYEAKRAAECAKARDQNPVQHYAEKARALSTLIELDEAQVGFDNTCKRDLVSVRINCNGQLFHVPWWQLSDQARERVLRDCGKAA